MVDGDRPAVLFLKKIVEGAASIRRLDGKGLTTISATGLPCFPLDRRASHEELTFIPQIFLCDPFGNRLCAFESRRRIKMAAILADVEVGLALWTLAFVLNIDWRRNDRA